MNISIFSIIDLVQKVVTYSIKLVDDDIANSPDMRAKLQINKFAMEMTTFHGRNI